jgi:hypothetical protein
MEFDHYIRLAQLRAAAKNPSEAISNPDELLELLLLMFRPRSSRKSQGFFDRLVAHLEFCLDTMEVIFMNLDYSVGSEISDEQRDRLVWFRVAIEMLHSVAMQIKKGR